MSRWKKYTVDSIIPDAPACYAVFVDGKLVYVGQSQRVRRRLLAGHRFNYARYSARMQTPWGQYRKVSFKIRYSQIYGDWLVTEGRLISRLRPEHNRLGVRRDGD